MRSTRLDIMDNIFNQMSDIAVIFEVVNGKFKYLKANASAYKAGYSDERYGKFVEDAIPEPHASNYNRILGKAFSTRKPVRYEENISSATGRQIGDIIINPIFNSQGVCTHLIAIGRDVTVQKETEKELLRTKAFLESFLASTTDGILVSDTNLNIIRMNHGFSKMFGWEVDEVEGLSFEDLNLIPKDYEHEHQGIAKDLLQGKNIPAHRTVRQKKNGSLLYVSSSYSPLRSENGEIIGLIAIYRDVTDQVVKENQLEVSRQTYRSLVDNHPDAVFQFNLEGRFINANHRFEKITGYKLAEYKNLDFTHMIAKDTLEQTIENFQVVVKGETRNYHCAIINKQGERIEVDVTNVPIVVNGNIMGVFGIAKNITEQKRVQDELTRTKETLESFFNSTIDAIDIVDLNQRVLEINPAFEQTFGYSKEEIIGENISLVFPKEEVKSDVIFNKVLNGTIVHDYEVTRIKKDGELIDVSLSLSPIRDAEGNITSVSAISRDISEKKQADRRIKESESRYRLIAENMRDLVSLIDPSYKLLYVSPSHSKVLGVPTLESETLPIEKIHEEDRKEVITSFQQTVEKKQPNSISFRYLHGEGHYVWLDTHLTPVFNEDGELQHILTVSRDVTNKRNYEKQLEEMAFYDYLTKIPNRRLFMERLNYTISQSKRSGDIFAILSFDVDRFKWVNDTMGHDVGDQLLVEFVKRIHTCIREVDTFGRIGGDEFLILLPGVQSRNEVSAIAERILGTLQHPWKIGEHSFVTTSSIGIAFYPSDGEDAFTILKTADQALYKAKQFGKNNYQFYADHVEGQELELIVESDISKALENNEFFLVYQPKYNLLTKQLESYEALIRWNHKEKGLIPPIEFIPQAEKYNLIIPITKWVLKQACLQVKNWQQDGYMTVPVSVNISPLHFENGRVLEDVKEILSETQLDPGYLVLEITESVMFKEADAAIKVIQDLRNIGIRIAIDDFGTGFSSLSYLMRLPIDIVKLDKSFIQELTGDKKNISLVQSIVSLAHNLNLIVIAEGIETEKQNQILISHGCDIGQGYFFSKPLMNDQLEKIHLKKYGE